MMKTQQWRRFRKTKKAQRTTALKDGSTPERIIQAQILLWLSTTELLHWRQNSGKIPVHGRLVNLGPDGISDIVLVIPPNGRFMGLEVKSANGAVRPDQKAFKAKLEAAGGIYRIVRSLVEAQNAVAEALGAEKLCKAMPSSRAQTTGLTLN